MKFRVFVSSTLTVRARDCGAAGFTTVQGSVRHAKPNVASASFESVDVTVKETSALALKGFPPEWRTSQLLRSFNNAVMALLEGLIPPSREKWELLVFIFQVMPVVSYIPALLESVPTFSESFSLRWSNGLQTGGHRAEHPSNPASTSRVELDGS